MDEPDEARVDIDARRRAFARALVALMIITPFDLLMSRLGYGIVRGPVTAAALTAVVAGLAWALARLRRGEPLAVVTRFSWKLGFAAFAVIALETPFVIDADLRVLHIMQVHFLGILTAASAYLTFPLREARRAGVAAGALGVLGLGVSWAVLGGTSAVATLVLTAVTIVVLIDVHGASAAAFARSEEQARAKAFFADHDELTGLRNRRGMSALLADRWPTALMIIDIDHFKQVNDVHGHATGDAVLRDVARALAGAVREEDSVGRWGGEEFLVVASTTNAAAVGERLRAAVGSADTSVPVTASIGVALPRPGDTPDTTLGRADEALYEAKRAGRDRVVCAVADADADAAGQAR